MTYQVNTKCLEQEIVYTGSELTPHWVSQKTGEFGSGLVAFKGAAEVASEELVDLEDRRADAIIRAKSMLHFLGEFFERDLSWTIAQQRLLTAIITDVLRAQVDRGEFSRKGDDVFWRDNQTSNWRKLTVSIVTGSPVSCLLHFGINIDPAGAPVDAIGLDELGLKDWSAVAQEVMAKFSAELDGQWRARTKVMPR